MEHCSILTNQKPFLKIFFNLIPHCSASVGTSQFCKILPNSTQLGQLELVQEIKAASIVIFIFEIWRLVW